MYTGDAPRRARGGKWGLGKIVFKGRFIIIRQTFLWPSAILLLSLLLTCILLSQTSLSVFIRYTLAAGCRKDCRGVGQKSVVNVSVM